MIPLFTILRFMLHPTIPSVLCIPGIVFAWVLVPSIVYPIELKKPCKTFDWDTLPTNQWTKLSTCREAAPKVFHGASALASNRRTVFFFGADTHDKDYDNSVYRLSLENLQWSKDYKADALDTYRVTPEGYAVTTSKRPWAMHTFDGWDYDPSRGTLVLVGTPKHATKAIQLLKDQGKMTRGIKPATWHYDPDRRSWQLIHTQTPNLFAGGFAWDPLGKRFIGHNGHQTFHYDPQHQEWVTYLASSVPGYHLRLVYDTFAHAFLSLGNNHNHNELWSYRSQSVSWKRVIVAQPPLPASGAAIAYDTHRHVLLYVANDSATPYENPTGRSVTFLYISQTHQWLKLPVKSPPLFGMNYLTQYDPISDVFLHFEKSSASYNLLSVWAFRYRP